MVEPRTGKPHLDCLRLLVFCLLAAIAWSGCSPGGETVRPIPSQEEALSPEPILTVVEPTSTLLPTATSSPVPTPTPTPTPQPITVGNVSTLAERVRLGKASIVGLAHWPDEDTLAIVTQTGIQYMDALSLQEERFIEWAVEGPAYHVGFSPDGHTIAVLAWPWQDGLMITLVDAESGAVRRSLPVDSEAISKGGPVFNFDGSLIAFPKQDGTMIWIWDSLTGELVRSLGPHSGDLTSALFHPTMPRLAVADRSGTVTLWDSDAGERVWRIQANEGRFLGSRPSPSWALAFSRDGELLAVGGWGWISLWSVRSGEKIVSMHTAGNIQSIAFSLDDTLLAASSSSTSLIYSIPTGELIGELKIPLYASDLSFSSDGSRLATGGSGAVVLWDITTREVLAERLDYGVGAVAFHPDGTSLGMATSAGVRVWDTTTWKESRWLPGHREGLDTLAYSPDGRFLATYEKSGLVRVWDLDSHQEVHQLSNCVSGFGSGSSVAFSPDASHIAVGCWENTAWLVDLADTENADRFQLHDAPVGNSSVDVAFHPAGTLLAIAGRDGRIAIVDIKSKRVVRMIRTSRGITWSIAFSGDGAHLAEFSSDPGESGTVTIWSTDTWERRLEFPGSGPFAFSSSGDLIAVGNEDSLQMYDTSDGRLLHEVSVSRIFQIAFSPDDRFLALRHEHELSIWGVSP